MVRVMDSTGDAPMLIWDRECYDLVGVSASSLREKYARGICKDEDVLSKFFRNLETEVHIPDQNEEKCIYVNLHFNRL
nr:replication protein A 70 kDa DNA-binding subunit B-like [Ipomoea batatas]